MGRSNRDVNDENTITVFGKSFAKAFGVSYITARLLNAAFDVDGAAEAEQKRAEKIQAQMRADLEQERQKEQSHKEEQSKIEEQERVLKAKKKAEAELRELEKYGGSMKEIIDNFTQRFEEDGGLDIFKF